MGSVPFLTAAAPAGPRSRGTFVAASELGARCFVVFWDGPNGDSPSAVPDRCVSTPMPVGSLAISDGGRVVAVAHVNPFHRTNCYFNEPTRTWLLRTLVHEPVFAVYRAADERSPFTLLTSYANSKYMSMAIIALPSGSSKFVCVYAATRPSSGPTSTGTPSCSVVEYYYRPTVLRFTLVPESRKLLLYTTSSFPPEVSLGKQSMVDAYSNDAESGCVFHVGLQNTDGNSVYVIN